MGLSTFYQDLTKKQRLIDQALRRYLPSSRQELVRAIRYSALAPGKRLRPMLVLTTLEACGGERERGLPCACVVEMIHTYSLIHDDLPAMDDDDYRRGRLTCHKQFSESTAILAGDALSALAYQVLTRTSRKGLPETTFPYLVSLLSQSIYRMILGQMMDLEAEGKQISLRQLKELYANKTGALIACSVQFGALLSGLSPQDKNYQLLSHYANHLGLAFQIVDDILDETGDLKKMGKRPGQDRMHEKATYPALVGLTKARQIASKEGAKAKHMLKTFQGDRAVLEQLVDFVLAREV